MNFILNWHEPDKNDWAASVCICSSLLYAPKHYPNWSSITNFEINLNWMELKVSTFFSFNLSYIDWISVFLRFYTIRFPSAILCRQMMKAQNVSCFENCSNTLICISLFHWSNPKQISSIFSFNLSHDVHQFESVSLDQMIVKVQLKLCSILNKFVVKFKEISNRHF